MIGTDAQWDTLALLAYDMATTVTAVSTAGELNKLRERAQSLRAELTVAPTDAPLATVAYCFDEALRNYQVALDCWGRGQEESHHFNKLGVQWEKEAEHLADTFGSNRFAARIENHHMAELGRAS